MTPMDNALALIRIGASYAEAADSTGLDWREIMKAWEADQAERASPRPSKGRES
jgi:hypothetical protein